MQSILELSDRLHECFLHWRYWTMKALRGYHRGNPLGLNSTYHSDSLLSASTHANKLNHQCKGLGQKPEENTHSCLDVA